MSRFQTVSRSPLLTQNNLSLALLLLEFKPNISALLIVHVWCFNGKPENFEETVLQLSCYVGLKDIFLNFNRVFTSDTVKTR